MKPRSLVFLVSSAAVAAVGVVAGCGTNSEAPQSSADHASNAPASSNPSPAAAAKAFVLSDDQHAHEPGAHGGTIVEIGRDSYHAEAVFEKGGQLRLHMLGQDETRVQEVELQQLTAYAKPRGGTESVQLTFRPEPQRDDSEGKTSLFIAQLPDELTGQAVSVTIPSIRINGERFRLGFESPEPTHEVGFMPEAVGGEEERALYLTPGGKYTAEDIAANGNVTASQKFAGVMAAHDLHPKPGDKVCPITLTKANPKFTWIVGGKPYEFCCPPCIDEFVRLAKESPDDIRDPSEYVRR